jgi:hypothetical protein
MVEIPPTNGHDEGVESMGMEDRKITGLEPTTGLPLLKPSS